MKKILALILALALVLGLATVAFADDEAPDTNSEYDARNGGFSITITNPEVGETYTPYKIFDVTYADDDGAVTASPNPDGSDASHEHGAYSYTIDSNSEWWNVVTNSQALTTTPAEGEDPVEVTEFTANGLKFTKTALNKGTDAAPVYVFTVEAVTEGENAFDAAAFAKLIKDAIDAGDVTPTPAAEAITAAYVKDEETGEDAVDENGEKIKAAVKFTLDNPGYYFVTTSLGSLCSLDTTEPDAKIVEKNSKPDVDKTIVGGETVNTSDVNIGDVVNYQTIISAKPGAVNYVLHDKMTDGLTLNEDSIEVKVDDKALTIKPAEGESSYDYEVLFDLEDGCDFEIVFTKEYLDSITEATDIVVTYSATLNEDAVVAVPGNTNETKLVYGEDNNHETEYDKTVTYTWDFDLFKFTKEDNSETALAGAEFQIYKKVTTVAEADTTDGDAAATETEVTLKFVEITEDDPRYVAGHKNYRLAIGDEEGAVDTLVTPEEGFIYIFGLDAGTYYLKETKAPAGYNALANDVEIVITAEVYTETDAVAPFKAGDLTGECTVKADGKDPAKHTHEEEVTDDNGKVITPAVIVNEIKIENNKGTELPSTGGIGTTIFYIVGSMMAVGAGIILVTKKRLGVEA